MLLSREINDFYREKLTLHGVGAKGVGWKDSAAQEVRFLQLIRIIQPDETFSINDIGCGTGDLIRLLASRFGSLYSYAGYDSLEEMIVQARLQFAKQNSVRFLTITDYDQVELADYSVASGIFNVRNHISDSDWNKYILETITTLSRSSRKGFAFNALTRYSDQEKIVPELFYSDPLYLFDYCKKHFSQNVALLHDYGIHDFTILVRKG